MSERKRAETSDPKTENLKPFSNLRLQSSTKEYGVKPTKGLLEYEKSLTVPALHHRGSRGFGRNKPLLNADKGGVAIEGYDSVAFYTQGKPVKGLSQFESKIKIARYLLH